MGSGSEAACNIPRRRDSQAWHSGDASTYHPIPNTETSPNKASPKNMFPYMKNVQNQANNENNPNQNRWDPRD